MPDGKVFLDADGREVLDASGKTMLANASDACPDCVNCTPTTYDCTECGDTTLPPSVTLDLSDLTLPDWPTTAGGIGVVINWPDLSGSICLKLAKITVVSNSGRLVCSYVASLACAVDGDFGEGPTTLTACLLITFRAGSSGSWVLYFHLTADDGGGGTVGYGCGDGPIMSFAGGSFCDALPSGTWTGIAGDCFGSVGTATITPNAGDCPSDPMECGGGALNCYFFYLVTFNCDRGEFGPVVLANTICGNTVSETDWTTPGPILVGSNVQIRYSKIVKGGTCTGAGDCTPGDAPAPPSAPNCDGFFCWRAYLAQCAGGSWHASYIVGSARCATAAPGGTSWTEINHVTYIIWVQEGICSDGCADTAGPLPSTTGLPSAGSVCGGMACPTDVGEQTLTVAISGGSPTPGGCDPFTVQVSNPGGGTSFISFGTLHFEDGDADGDGAVGIDCNDGVWTLTVVGDIVGYSAIFQASASSGDTRPPSSGWIQTSGDCTGLSASVS